MARLYFVSDREHPAGRVQECGDCRSTKSRTQTYLPTIATGPNQCQCEHLRDLRDSSAIVATAAASAASLKLVLTQMRIPTSGFDYSRIDLRFLATIRRFASSLQGVDPPCCSDGSSARPSGGRRAGSTVRAAHVGRVKLRTLQAAFPPQSASAPGPSGPWVRVWRVSLLILLPRQV